MASSYSWGGPGRRRVSRHLVAISEGRVPHDEVHPGPVGLPGVVGVGEVEDGVLALEGVHGAEDGVAPGAGAVLAGPLEVADPDGHLGELEGVRVDLDAVELPGAHEGDLGGEAVVQGEDGDLLLQVLELLEGDVEEVAGAAGGVEDPDVGEALVEAAQEHLGLVPGLLEPAAGGRGLRAVGLLGVLLAGREEVRDELLDLAPLAPEGLPGRRARLTQIGVSMSSRLV